MTQLIFLHLYCPTVCCWVLRVAQVYYAPRLAFFRSDTFPTVFGAFSLLRDIVIQEGIQLVHAHQVG